MSKYFANILNAMLILSLAIFTPVILVAAAATIALAVMLLWVFFIALSAWQLAQAALGKEVS